MNNTASPVFQHLQSLGPGTNGPSMDRSTATLALFCTKHPVGQYHVPVCLIRAWIAFLLASLLIKACLARDYPRSSIEKRMNAHRDWGVVTETMWETYTGSCRAAVKNHVCSNKCYSSSYCHADVHVKHHICNTQKNTPPKGLFR
jgi:hypothetical protein